MERLQILLKQRDHQVTRDLAFFIEALSLYSKVGYDLAYCWPLALNSMQSLMVPALHDQLKVQQGSLAMTLEELVKMHPVERHRMWFSVIGQIYASGAGIGQVLEAFSSALRQELDREIDEHCRALPTKINVISLLVFFPAAAVLLFVPLLLEVLRQLPSHP